MTHALDGLLLLSLPFLLPYRERKLRACDLSVRENLGMVLSMGKRSTL